MAGARRAFLGRNPAGVCKVVSSSFLLFAYFWGKGQHPLPLHKDVLFMSWPPGGVIKFFISRLICLGNVTLVIYSHGSSPGPP
jgi:hypothetical protein